MGPHVRHHQVDTDTREPGTRTDRSPWSPDDRQFQFVKTSAFTKSSQNGILTRPQQESQDGLEPTEPARPTDAASFQFLNTSGSTTGTRSPQDGTWPRRALWNLGSQPMRPVVAAAAGSRSESPAPRRTPDRSEPVRRTDSQHVRLHERDAFKKWNTDTSEEARMHWRIWSPNSTSSTRPPSRRWNTDPSEKARTDRSPRSPDDRPTRRSAHFVVLSRAESFFRCRCFRSSEPVVRYIWF